MKKIIFFIALFGIIFSSCEKNISEDSFYFCNNTEGVKIKITNKSGENFDTVKFTIDNNSFSIASLTNGNSSDYIHFDNLRYSTLDTKESKRIYFGHHFIGLTQSDTIFFSGYPKCGFGLISQTATTGCFNIILTDEKTYNKKYYLLKQVKEVF